MSTWRGWESRRCRRRKRNDRADGAEAPNPKLQAPEKLQISKFQREPECSVAGREVTESGFKDHFSRQAADYAKFRPRYPKELFRWLASVAPETKLAWDCATGNGQAAVAL